MPDHVKTREQLIDELTDLHSQVVELETALKGLHEPESKYREMIDSVSEAVFVIQYGFITFSNQVCSELTGYSREETSTFNAIILLVHPDDQEMVAQNHARRLQGDTRHLRYDFRIICKHGTVKWVELNSSLIMWEGKPAALCLATDITERKQTEESLKESQDLIKVLVDSLPVGLLYVDSLERIIFANQTFGSWWGMPGANLSGHTVENILSDHYAVIQNGLKTALAGQEMFYEEQVKYKDGVTREIVAFYAPHIVANGQVKGVACLIQDITQLKQVERELRESKQRLELALEAGAIGLWDWNLKTGRAIGGEWTTRLRQNVGYETEPWPDVRSWKRSVHPDDWNKVSEALNGHLSGRLPFFEAQLRMRSKSDEWKWYQSRGKVVEYDKEGKPLRISGTTADVTERRQAEEELRKNEEKYRHLVENAYDIVYTTDRNGCVTFVNPACLLHIGYSREELIGRNYLEFIPEEYREHISGFYGRQVVKKVPNTSYDFPFIAKNGEIRWFVQNTQLLMKEDSVVGFQAIARDITESKRADEALRNSVSLLHSTLESTADGILVVDGGNRIAAFNKRFLDLWKIPQDIMESRDDVGVLAFVLDQLVNPGAFFKKVKELYSKPEIESFDTLEFKDGRVFERYSRPQWIADTVVGRVWNFRDVTERKMFIDTLNMEKQRFQRLAESAPFGMVIIQSDGTFSYTNPKFREMFGYGLSEVPNGREWFRKAFPDPDLRHQAISQWIEDFKDCGQGETRPRVFSVISKDGNQKIIHFRPVKLVSGEDLMTCEDITDRKRAEQEKEELQIQYLQAQKMEAIGTLTGGIAHDFNNLLQVILGHSEMLLNDEQLGEKVRANLRQIVSAGRSGVELIQRLMIFSRKRETNFKPTDLNYEAEQLQKMLVRTFSKKIEIELALDSKLATVNADPAQIDQILMNLAVNARDSMPNGGRLSIQTENVILDEGYCVTNPGVKPGDYVLMTVSDTGSGMDKETLGRIFEPFFTTKEVGKGTGLGLSVVYQIVRRHGGHIYCYSEPGLGTTFKIYLPAIPPKEEASEETTEETTP